MQTFTDQPRPHDQDPVAADVEPDIDQSDIDQADEGDTTDEGSQPGRSKMNRRGVLGAMAAGAFLAACGKNGDLASDPFPSTSTTAGGSSTTGAATSAGGSSTSLTITVSTEPVFDSGPAVGQVVLPSPGGAGTGAGAGAGTGASAGAAPSNGDVLMVDDGTGTAGSPSGSSGSPGANTSTGAGTSSGGSSSGATPTETTAASSTETTASTAAPAEQTGSNASSTTTAAPSSGGSSDNVIVVDDGTGSGATSTSTTAAPSDANTSTTAGPTETTAAPSTETTAAPAPNEPADPGPSTPAPTINSAAGVETVVAKLTFGPTPSLISDVASMGAAAYIQDQLGRTSADGEVERRMSGYKYLGRNPAQALAANENRTGARDIVDDMNHANFVRARYSRNQLYEMMCHLWMDHFNIHLTDHQVLWADYESEVVRANAMGSFRDMLVASANHPGMLHYLDNDVSNASDALNVNENYGRELLELHTLGIEPNGNQVYGQADVEQAALAMSGWSTRLNRREQPYGVFRFRNDYAYGGEVSILNGAWRSNGQTGKARGDSLLQFLATHSSTAKHIAYKICRRFVSDSPSQGLIDSTARVYLDNDTRIVPMLAHVFSSDEFANAGGQKVRRPFEFTVATLRATGADLPYNRAQDPYNTVRRYLASVRHKTWNWEQPDGYPDRADHWIVADSFLYRWNFAAGLPRNRSRGISVNLGQVRPGGVGTADELVAALARRFGIGTLSSDVVNATLTAAGRSSGDPAADVDERGLEAIVGLLLANPLFQIR